MIKLLTNSVPTRHAENLALTLVKLFVKYFTFDHFSEGVASFNFLLKIYFIIIRAHFLKYFKNFV